ncbi:hypothetical protein NTE_01173 [Candidatus Nitrososphaera evergladensis SR1]|uniref:Uncharacterized protein n=1 Tax=Candidatus Nitrososphaera evergladensis SR1 TaxID=1459636 RepID=A0A075MNZ6_9ARCH|nr:hypothetical protein NTE_01173 [Candidatus Nitrososphaera evergladensis SR1]
MNLSEENAKAMKNDEARCSKSAFHTYRSIKSKAV